MPSPGMTSTCKCGRNRGRFSMGPASPVTGSEASAAGAVNSRPSLRRRSPPAGRRATPVFAQRPSAGSGDLLSGRGLFLGRVGLLEVLLLFTAIVQADPGLDLLGAEQTLRLSDGLLAVLPARLDWVEPRALAGQL